MAKSLWTPDHPNCMNLLDILFKYHRWIPLHRYNLKFSWKAHQNILVFDCLSLYPFSQRSIFLYRVLMLDKKTSLAVRVLFIPKVFNRVGVRARCRPLKVLHQGAQSWIGSSPNFCHSV